MTQEINNSINMNSLDRVIHWNYYFDNLYNLFIFDLFDMFRKNVSYKTCKALWKLQKFIFRKKLLNIANATSVKSNFFTFNILYLLCLKYTRFSNFSNIILICMLNIYFLEKIFWLLILSCYIKFQLNCNINKIITLSKMY